MNSVPEMISTKDLLYIADAFEWNLTAYKKAEAYLLKISDEKMKKELESIGKKHKKICSYLLKILG